MSIISKWCKRMEKIKYKLSDSAYIEGKCPYGKEYFCDGRPNRAASKDGRKLLAISPCKHFVNGRCELELHKKKNTD